MPRRAFDLPRPWVAFPGGVERLLARPVLFVTGTDTDVGKTVATAALARAFVAAGRPVCAVKPIASGCEMRRGGRHLCEDAARILAASGDGAAEALVSIGVRAGEAMVAFRRPLGPVSAAALEGRKVPLVDITRRVRRLVRVCSNEGRTVLLEGVGGALVPVGGRTLVADWIASLGVPAIVVTRTRLGTINHTLLTLEALAARGVEVAAVIASRAEDAPLDEVERCGLAEIGARLDRRVPAMILGRQAP